MACMLDRFGYVVKWVLFGMLGLFCNEKRKISRFRERAMERWTEFQFEFIIFRLDSLSSYKDF